MPQKLNGYKQRLRKDATNIGASMALRTEGHPQVESHVVLVRGTATLPNQEAIHDSFVSEAGQELEVLRETDVPDDNAIIEALVKLATLVHNELQTKNTVVKAYCTLFLNGEKYNTFMAVAAYSEERGTYVVRKGESDLTFRTQLTDLS